MQQPEWSSTYRSSPTPHRYWARCTGYRWLLESNSRHWHLRTVLRMALAHPTSRKWLATSSQRGGHSYRSIKSQSSAILAPQWWNELPIDIRSAETLHTFRRWLKTHLFRLHLGTWRKTNKKNKNTFYLSFFSNVALEAVWSCICIFFKFDVLAWILLRFVYIHMVECIYCESLWIKASAKCL